MKMHFRQTAPEVMTQVTATDCTHVASVCEQEVTNNASRTGSASESLCISQTDNTY